MRCWISIYNIFTKFSFFFFTIDFAYYLQATCASHTIQRVKALISTFGSSLKPAKSNTLTNITKLRHISHHRNCKHFGTFLQLISALVIIIGILSRVRRAGRAKLQLTCGQHRDEISEVVFLPPSGASLENHCYTLYRLLGMYLVFSCASHELFPGAFVRPDFARCYFVFPYLISPPDDDELDNENQRATHTIAHAHLASVVRTNERRRPHRERGSRSAEI